MKDINQVLAQKERELALVQREVDALKLVVAMLQESPEHINNTINSSNSTPVKREWP